MNIYEELKLDTIINASDTYTRLGGSRMSHRTLEAMREAGESFVDITEMSNAICRAIASRTDNETAFISSGAGACVVLAASSCITEGKKELADMLPDAGSCKRNEIIIFSSQKECVILPYWRLISLSGATLIPVADDLGTLKAAITPRTAAIFFFAGTVYEWTTPTLSQIIPIAHEKQIPVIVDAAAQLPSKKLMSYYTVSLGADAVIFSGGKFINGPQTTGIILGSHKVIDPCSYLASPNVHIGRPYKVGKEEYAGLYRACMDFLDSDEAACFRRLKTVLEKIRASLIPTSGYQSHIEDCGRLGQQIPMLYLDFTDGRTGQECYDFMYASPDRVDVGTFVDGDPTGDCHRIFINAINLREPDIPVLIRKLNLWLQEGGQIS